MYHDIKYRNVSNIVYYMWCVLQFKLTKIPTIQCIEMDMKWKISCKKNVNSEQVLLQTNPK